MRYFILYILFATSPVLVFSQDTEYENKVIKKLKNDITILNQQKKIIKDLSGVCDVVTEYEDPVSLPFSCDGEIYEGIIEFEKVDFNKYNVYSESLTGEMFNDPSFGAYYACYETDSQSGMANANADFPTLFFAIDHSGDITYSGSSQWGETFFIEDVEMDEDRLNFKWYNDYGEGAFVDLDRHDDRNWEDLLAPCNVCSESDSLALVAIYNATGGANWNITWDLNAPVHTWYGVGLNDSCCVSVLDMGPSTDLENLGFDNNNLVGALPKEIKNLTALTILDMRNNNLEGSIFPRIIDLPNLEILCLNNNSFTETITGEIELLENLKALFISENNFEGSLPIELGNLTNLEYLSAWGNDFSGNIPDQLGNLSELILLSLGFNDLGGNIPESLGQLTELNRLALQFNQLEGIIPPGFEYLDNIILNDNNFEGEVPTEFASKSYVTNINLSSNNFSGPLPGWVINDFDSQSLFLANNDFTGCIDSIVNLCNKHGYLMTSIEVGGETYVIYSDNGHDLSGNPKLAWEGVYENLCDGANQIGAPCDDGDPNTSNDGLNEDCECVPDIVSVHNISGLKSISISPNPLSLGESIVIHLDLESSVDLGVRLYDYAGRIISKKSLGIVSGKYSYQLNTEDLTPGLYMIQLTTEMGAITRKIVVQ